MSLAALPTDRALTAEEIVAASKAYTMFSWSAGDTVDPIPWVRAEGVWMWDKNGKRYLDWNSQSMCVNIGHGNKKVIKAIADQAASLAYVGSSGATEIRARLGEKLAKLMPGHLNSVFFTLGGGEANENAVRAARGVTGRQKVIARYRSYHGATALSINMTGDQRRWSNEPGPPGIIHVMDPQPYSYSFGNSPEEISRNNLQYLEETIMYEGGHTIACFVLETMTGTNGALPPPPGYLAGVRKLCDDNGIMMICDEVMTGFGRTGRMFAFEHAGPDVVPDLITMAKGLTSSYLPLGAVGLSDQVAAYYKKNVFYGGHTYNSHPTCLAAALANIEVLEEEGMVENAAKLEAVMLQEMAKLQAKHPCVKDYRCTGLFGMVELQKTSTGAPFSPYGKVGAEMAGFGRLLRDKGLITFIKATNFTCMPPLCITEAELLQGFTILDDALHSMDAQMTG